MSTRTKKLEADRKSHQRSALIQWVAIGLVVALGLVAILLLTDATTYGGHSGVITLLQS
jgi:tetrahydromethanopterin S-methyltransferase subunit F